MSSDSILRSFGARIRARRLELGLSQEKLAELAGLHRTYIGSVERGERNVSLLNIRQIALALKLDPSDLVATKNSHSVSKASRVSKARRRP